MLRLIRRTCDLGEDVSRLRFQVNWDWKLGYASLTQLLKLRFQKSGQFSDESGVCYDNQWTFVHV